MHLLQNGDMIDEAKVMEEEARNPGYLKALIGTLKKI